MILCFDFPERRAARKIIFTERVAQLHVVLFVFLNYSKLKGNLEIFTVVITVGLIATVRSIECSLVPWKCKNVSECSLNCEHVRIFEEHPHHDLRKNTRPILDRDKGQGIVSVALCIEHSSVRSRSRFKAQPMRALAGSKACW